MGQLLRGAVENFNPQIHTEKNSLTVKMQKHFAVARKTFDLFTKYNKFQSWMYYSGRVNQGARAGKMKPATKDINDNAYRIAYEGMDILPAYAFGKAYIGGLYDAANPNPDPSGITGAVQYHTGTTDTTVETNKFATIFVKHDPDNNIFGDKFNPNDKFILGAGLGTQFIIVKEGRKSSGGDAYAYDCKVIGDAAIYDASGLAEDSVLTEGGNAFGEGSLRGYQRSAKNQWRINHSFVSRYTLTMTGAAKRQKIAYIYNNESKTKYWEFNEVLRAEKIFRMQNELSMRYNRSTMDVSNHAWFENFGSNKLTLNGFKAETGIEAPIIGNGWIPEIEDNATFEYNPNNGLAHTMIEAITNVLSTRSPMGSSGNTFLAIGDRIGRTAFDRGMKVLMQYDTNSSTSGASNIIYDVTTGAKMELGFEVVAYHYLGNKFVFIEDELLNHPGLFAMNGGLVGSGHIFILNASPVDGVPNFEVFADPDRANKKRYVDGLTSLDPKGGSMHTSSGFDGAQIHLFSELMPVLYDVKSCGILKASTAYTGGDLTGNAFANQRANSFTF